jgi:PIN domain nuclease of toxin-antitoxin system
VRLLLDTNALIWTLVSPERLSNTAREAIRTGENMVYVSPVAAWEIGVLRVKKGLQAPEDIEAEMRERDFEHLPITMKHTLAESSLPRLHEDPFDRFLIAQAQVEELTIVTSDRMIRRYPVAVLPAY